MTAIKDIEILTEPAPSVVDSDVLAGIIVVFMVVNVVGSGDGFVATQFA